MVFAQIFLTISNMYINRKFKAICFDLDGVLVDAVNWHFVALNKALRLFGYAMSEELHQTTFNGLPTKTKLMMLSQKGELPFSLHNTISNLKQKYTEDLIAQHCKPDYEKILLLKKLKQDNIKLACCSNAKTSSVFKMLEMSGLKEYFKIILTNEDVTRPKPDPEIYRAAFEKLGVLPEETAIVEDAPYGQRAAQNSGGYLIPVNSYNEVNLSLFY